MKQIKKYVDWLNKKKLTIEEINELIKFCVEFLNKNASTQEELAKEVGISSRWLRYKIKNKIYKEYKLKAIRLYENNH
jgi:predicted HTH transcriptional regulator